MNIVRKTTLEIIKRAKSVRINRERIITLAKKWVATDIKVPPRAKEDILDTKDERKLLDYLIILDTTNFCFWSKKQKWSVGYKGKQYDGYYALSVSWKKYFENNPKKANLNFFSEISFNNFRKILNGKGKLQFLHKRWQMVRETSRIIIKKYDGDSRKFIKSSHHRFSNLVSKTYRELPSFRDISVYNGEKVYLLKRAQILACDICFAFNNKGIGYFKDLDYLTAMADYRLPQILYHLGILEYSKELENKIKKKTLIKAGSKEEVEIRSATVWAIEYLREELRKRDKKFYAYEIDWILWDKSQKEKMTNNYHLTKSIFY